MWVGMVCVSLRALCWYGIRWNECALLVTWRKVLFKALLHLIVLQKISVSQCLSSHLWTLVSNKGGIKCLDNNIDDWTEKSTSYDIITLSLFSIVVVHFFHDLKKVSTNDIIDSVQELCKKLKCMWLMFAVQNNGFSSWRNILRKKTRQDKR